MRLTECGKDDDSRYVPEYSVLKPVDWDAFPDQ